jgi:hypothetical protein
MRKWGEEPKFKRCKVADFSPCNLVSVSNDEVVFSKLGVFYKIIAKNGKLQFFSAER